MCRQIYYKKHKISMIPVMIHTSIFLFINNKINSQTSIKCIQTMQTE